MQTDSSAIWTWRPLRSASECTATVLMPISRQARMMRTAISPRLAMRIFLNIRVLRGLDLEERLAVFDRMAVGHQGLHDPAGGGRQHVLHDLHGFDGGHRLAGRDG